MYRNLGNKFKTIAKVFRWVFFGVMEAAGVILLFTGYPELNRALAATAAMVLAPLLAWILSLPFYAIGHMVENSDIRTDLAIRQYAALRASSAPSAKPAPAPAAEAPVQQSAPAAQQAAPAQRGASRPAGTWGQY